MTKEQILEKVHTRLFDEKMYGINCIAKDKVLQAMDDFAQQQLSAERERAGKLVEALKSTILIFNKLGYPKTAEFVKQTIAEYDTTTA